MTRREPPDKFSSDVPIPLVESGATPLAVVTVGRERSGDPQPRQLWVWNDGSARTIALELTRRSNSLVGDSKGSLFTDETRYDADAIFVIELRKPATYVLDIAVGGKTEDVRSRSALAVRLQPRDHRPRGSLRRHGRD